MAELIVALDFPDARQALSLAKTLRPEVSWLKVGLELFIAAGPELVLRLEDLGFKIFLDLKIYDIPNTAVKAAEAIARLGVGMTTIHCQGGEKMCVAVARAMAEINGPLTLGVTALTSFGEGEMPGIGKDPAAFALELAGMAAAWGLKGVICSAREARAIKLAYPGLVRVSPGIRLPGDNTQDQNRVASPGEAAAAGADFIVVGRPVTRSPRPREAVARILESMNEGASQR